MPQIQILDGRSDSIHPGSSIQMDKDHLPLLEDQNPVRRSEILSGTGRVKISLTNAVKSLSNVSGREADVTNIYMHQSVGSRSRRLHQCSEGSHLIRITVYPCGSVAETLIEPTCRLYHKPVYMAHKAARRALMRVINLSMT